MVSGPDRIGWPNPRGSPVRARRAGTRHRNGEYGSQAWCGGCEPAAAASRSPTVWRTAPGGAARGLWTGSGANRSIRPWGSVPGLIRKSSLMIVSKLGATGTAHRDCCRPLRGTGEATRATDIPRRPSRGQGVPGRDHASCVRLARIGDVQHVHVQVPVRRKTKLQITRSQC